MNSKRAVRTILAIIEIALFVLLCSALNTDKNKSITIIASIYAVLSSRNLWKVVEKE